MNPFTVWQLVDSAFPAGGFAHSWGLEAAWQGGDVPSEAALWQFLIDAVVQAGHGALPLVSSAHVTPDRLPDLDALCHAFLTNAVARRASCVQGRAFLATCTRVWPGAPMDALAREVASLHGHHAPTLGAALRGLDVSLDTAQRLSLYSCARGVLSAAVRLGIVGPYAAQRLQHDCARHMESVLERCAALRAEHIAQTAPILDLLHATHDRLYSRLFQS